jgi:glycosyltransferase involved in cell wall biosynthesis
MSVVLVDWLGRGGIAQTTAAWAYELERRGYPVLVVTRAGRDLAGEAGRVVTAGGRGRLRSHRALAEAAAAAVLDERPSCVVVQNYVVPPLEAPLDAAVAAVGARLVAVVHDDRLHTWRAGTAVGLARRLRRADVVVTHTEAVAQRVTARSGRADIRVVPHPLPVGLLAAAGTRTPARPAGRWAAHFGVLRRRYKGTAVVESLAGTTPGWTFLALGVGAPQPQPGLVTRPGYQQPGALVDAVAATDATVLPYTRATQSGAVVLAQALGSVPVVSAVGGIPEQVTDGQDGVLLPPGAPVGAWRAALRDLEDDDRRRTLAAAGTARLRDQHQRFATAVAELVA